jgi:hypothetical protein
MAADSRLLLRAPDPPLRSDQGALGVHQSPHTELVTLCAIVVLV